MLQPFIYKESRPYTLLCKSFCRLLSDIIVSHDIGMCDERSYLFYLFFVIALLRFFRSSSVLLKPMLLLFISLSSVDSVLLPPIFFQFLFEKNINVIEACIKITASDNLVFHRQDDFSS